ncbi:MAG: RNA ligase family protein [Planctomycetota bacterium]|jgi:hypothetical protein|nr:RNA ligase family protein [Planctomycetota bacterium]
MRGDFFKFPSTPHLVAPAGIDLRGDKSLSEAKREEFLRHELVVEEKIDGANLGVSFDGEGNLRVQNRGAYLELPGAGQWRLLGDWLAPRLDALFDNLGDRHILFGEWCRARHSLFYDRLPDWFLGFDLYDREAGRFLAAARRDGLLAKMSLARVPFLARGRFSLSNLGNLLPRSRFSDQPAEGLYLRRDRGGWLEERAKLVRPEFIQSLGEHWSASPRRLNRLGRD